MRESGDRIENMGKGKCCGQTVISTQGSGKLTKSRGEVRWSTRMEIGMKGSGNRTSERAKDR